MSVKQVAGFIIGAGAIVATIVTGGLALPLTTKLLVTAGVLIASSVANALLRGPTTLQQRQGGFLAQRTSPEMPIPLGYGKLKLGAILVDLRVDESSVDNRRLLAVCAFCTGSHPDAPNAGEIDGIEEIWFDDRLAWTEATGVQAPFDTVIPPVDPIQALEYVGIHLGSTTQVVDPVLNATFPVLWPSTSQGRGIAYVVLELWRKDEVYPNGFPAIRAVVRGRLVHDPRDGMWTYNQNAALVVRDYLREPISGGDVPDTELDDEAFETAANVCDELVNGQARFELHGPVPVQQAVQTNLLEMAVCCRLNLPYVSGLFAPHIRTAQAVSGVVLDESNILDGSWSFAMPGSKDAANVGRGTFVYPEKDYEPDTVQWPEPGDPNSFLTEDNDHESRLELDFPYVENRQRALQLIATLVKEGRQGIVAAVTAKDAALELRFGDLVSVTHPTPGWDAKPFWVLPLAILPDATVQLLLMEYEPTVYDDTLTVADPSIPDTGFPDPFTVAAPTNLVLDGSVAVAQQNADGSYVPQILATWDRPVDPFVNAYEIQALETGSNPWDPWGTFAADSLEDTTGARGEQFLLTPVIGGVSWHVRVRAINSLGVRSAWVQQTVAVAAGPPTVDRITLSYDEDGFVRAEISTTNAPSIRIAFQDGSAPSAGAVAAGTIVATDGNGQAVAVASAATPIGMTAFVGVNAYELAGAGGVLFGPQYASITRASAGPSGAVPLPQITGAAYTPTTLTLDFDANLGADGIGPLEIRWRAYDSTDPEAAFTAWQTPPVTGVVFARLEYGLRVLELQARDNGFTPPVVGDFGGGLLFAIQPQNLINIGDDPDTGEAVPGSELSTGAAAGVFNAGFELATLAPWTFTPNGGTFTRHTTNPRSGVACLRYDPTGQTGEGNAFGDGDRGTFDGKRLAREGDVFFAEVWVRKDGAGVVNTVRVAVEYRDTAGNVPPGGNIGSTPITPTQTYQRIEVRAIAPANTMYGIVKLTTFADGNPEAILWDDVEFQRLHTAERIPDGAVITRTINDAAVNTAKLLDDAVTFDKVAANAIGVEQLFVGSFDNLITNPGFEQGAGATDDAIPGWNQVSGGGTWRTLASVIARSGANRLNFDPSGQTGDARFEASEDFVDLDGHHAATEGDQFYFEAYVRKVDAATANTVRVRILFRDEAGTFISGASSAFIEPTQAYAQRSVTATAPAGTAYVTFELSVNNDGNTNNIAWDDCYARRMVTGSIVVDGTILAQHLTVATLSAIAADVGVLTAGRIENAAGDAGILLSGPLPGGWDAYLNLTATGAEPFLLHPGLELRANGDSFFFGVLDILNNELSVASGEGGWMRGRLPGLSHGMTDLTATDVAYDIFGQDDLQGGVSIRGYTDDGSSTVIPLLLFGARGFASSTSAAAVQIHGRKKSTTTTVALASGELVFRVSSAAITTGIFDVYPEGVHRFQLRDGSANVAGVAGVVVSTAAASGDSPEGTIWLRV